MNNTAPQALEQKNGFQDGDGCPDELPPAVKMYSGTVKGINFATGKATILKPSFKVLDGAVKVLTDYPDLKIEIQGHTDDAGDDNANFQLSDARAASVRNYFLSKGIADDRITSKGFRESPPTMPVTDAAGKPLKGAKLNAARAANRRVEFKLISDLTKTDTSAETPATP